jgi:hypothetical protein
MTLKLRIPAGAAVRYTATHFFMQSVPVGSQRVALGTKSHQNDTTQNNLTKQFQSKKDICEQSNLYETKYSRITARKKKHKKNILVFFIVVLHETNGSREHLVNISISVMLCNCNTMNQRKQPKAVAEKKKGSTI